MSCKQPNETTTTSNPSIRRAFDFGALRKLRCFLSNSRNSDVILRMQAQSNSRHGISRLAQSDNTTIPGAIPGLDGNSNQGFHFAPDFRSVSLNWAGPCAPENPNLNTSTYHLHLPPPKTRFGDPRGPLRSNAENSEKFQLSRQRNIGLRPRRPASEYKKRRYP